PKVLPNGFKPRPFVHNFFSACSLTARFFHSPLDELGRISQISAGFQQVKLGERGGRRRDFNDAGIYTRQAMVHVKDSKSGTSGKPISLSSNFFRLLSCPQWVLYQYHIKFEPPMESRRLRSALIYQHEQTLGKAKIFDGGMLFLPIRLAQKETILHSETRNKEAVKITVTLTNELPPSSPVCIQFYNLILRKILKLLHLQQIGRNYYNPHDPLNIPQHKLKIWPGYVTTILHYESSIMMCIDISHKVLRSNTVLDFMTNLRAQYGDHRFADMCTKELVGCIVLTKYNNKTYRVDDIAWDHTPNNTFVKGDTTISFKKYFKDYHDSDIYDDNQVLLVSHVKKMGPAGGPPPGPAMLVPELCHLTGLTDKMRADYNIMRDMLKHTKLEPDARERRLTRFVNSIREKPDAQAELDQWGLCFDKQLAKLSGRVLAVERIYQGSKSFDYDLWKADWSREMRGNPVISSPEIKKWFLFHTRQNGNDAHSLLESLQRVSSPLGIHLHKPVLVSYDDFPESLLKALKQNVGPDTQMVAVILPSNRKDRYECVKKYLCVDFPVPSQCVVSRTLKPKSLMTVATKLALQMACKVGGELWSVEIPLKQLMVVGIDCYHDTSAGKRSIGALVASLNQTMTRWFSKCVLQHKGQEIMDGLKMALAGALKDYHKFNNCLPSRIIVYRDGVGDGQLHSVVNFEVAQILESIKTFGEGYEPKLSVVVVTKRISCRFFAHINGSVSNPPPGTVVDTEVTRPEWYDFYIVSQAVHNGSVSPTHYNVVYDTSGLKPDHMQRLTYKLCHMYFNWQGIIRVPAPCMYAHKLAFLVGQSIHKEPNTKLDDYLFYL
uniref:Piwi-like protein 1 n=1 Tax=Gouania willdenowi TaxID=441366 RepID=A0A8C5NGN7_GOUWI